MSAIFGFHPALRWPLPFGRAHADHVIRFDHDEPAPVRRLAVLSARRPLIAGAAPDGRDGTREGSKPDFFSTHFLLTPLAAFPLPSPHSLPL
jgi:hypothetical protein